MDHYIVIKTDFFLTYYLICMLVTDVHLSKEKLSTQKRCIIKHVLLMAIRNGLKITLLRKQWF